MEPIWQTTASKRKARPWRAFLGGKGAQGVARASAQGAAWKDRAPIFPTTPKLVGAASVAAPVERFEFRRKRLNA